MVFRKFIYWMKSGRTVDRGMAASYTVEAAFLMPIVLFIVLSILTFARYQYEVCKIQGFINEAIIQYSNMLSQHYDPENNRIVYEDYINENIFEFFGPIPNEKKEAFEAYLNHNYPKEAQMMTLHKVDVTATRKDIHIKIIYEINSPIPMTGLFFQNKNKIIESYGKVQESPEYVRVVSVIFQEVKKANIYDKVKDSVSKWVEYIK